MKVAVIAEGENNGFQMVRARKKIVRRLKRLQALTALIALFAFMAGICRGEEETWVYAVEVSATIQTSPPQILLSWPQDTAFTPSSYTVYRKGISDTSWGEGTVLDGTTTNYLDTNVVDGAAYEYQIVKVTSLYNGYGYIYAGMDVPLTEFRGTVLLIVDNTYADALTNQLAQLQQDLVGDGWTVIRHDVSPSDSVESVKSLILSDYNADPADVNTVFLFGHVPVPYSGDIAPDEHVPDHQGAWPADVYYADMYGTWTDSSVYDTNADDPRNWNVPGDGKFDQNYPPNPVQLMVGRVDLSNLPGETTWDGPPTLPGEESLLANYLNKDHNYRFEVFNLPRAGIIGNYFGDYGGEAFAASGWRNFAPFFGPQNITDLPNEGTWMPTLSSQPYLWSYGCGAGSYDSIAGLGNDNQYYTAITPDFYNDDIQTVFTMLFGSWFGDWDQQDDLMRGAIATPTYTLACMWSGSPHWFCHHMALGQTLGYSTRLTQNNGPNGLYQTQVPTYAGLIHVALMGDPTLRMHVVAPAANLASSVNGNAVQLIWNGSPDSLVGYNVYRSANPNGPFSRLNAQLVTGTSFTDSNPLDGTQTYMVRAIKLEYTASGTYYNASQGVFTSATASGSSPAVLNVSATASASRVGLVPGVFTISRSGDTTADLTANYSLSGSADFGLDYELSPTDAQYSITVPAGATTATLTVLPEPSPLLVSAETVQLTLLPSDDSEYIPGTQNSASITLGGNGVPGVSLRMSNSVPILMWPGALGRAYDVNYKNQLNAQWTNFDVQVQGSGTVIWSDPSPSLPAQRFYRVFEIK